MAMSQRMWRREQERKRRERAKRVRRKRICAVIVMLIAAAVCAVVFIRSCGGSGTVTEPLPSEGAAETTAVPTLYPAETQIPLTELDTSFYNDSVFIGNALADGISTYGLLPQTDIYAKVGISLDSAYNTAADNASTSIVDQLKSRKFNKVFLCFGEAELADRDPGAFYDKYEEMIDTVKDYQKSARIYLVAIPPVARTAAYELDDIMEYNDVIAELAYDNDVYYSDAYGGLAEDDGYLAEGVSADGINLNRNCYIRMLNYMADNSFVPDSGDLRSSDDEDEEESATERPRATSTPRATAEPEDDEDEPTPTPTQGVNVLKDSAQTERPKSESEDSE